MNETSALVARNVASLRNARKWSLRELSDRTAQAGHRVPFTAIHRMENPPGGISPAIPVDYVWALAVAFNCSVSNLCAKHPCSTCLGAPAKGFKCNSCGRISP